MSKRKSQGSLLTQQQNDHKSNQKNPNYKTDGVNPAYAKVHGNKGKLLNPNQKNKD